MKSLAFSVLLLHSIAYTVYGKIWSTMSLTRYTIGRSMYENLLDEENEKFNHTYVTI